jgi:PAS domain S-box-containing protein
MLRRKALAVALLVIVALLGLWWGTHVWYRNTLFAELRGDVLAELYPYGNALTIDLRRRFDLINGFGAWVSTASSLAEIDEKFALFARQLSESIAGVGNLSIALDGVTRLVYPRAGNEASLGRNLFDDPRAEVRQDALRALQSRKIVISGPYELTAGGLGAVARLAVFHQEKFWGLVNVALKLPPIFAEAGITSQKNLKLALRDGRGRLFFGAPAVFDSNPIIHRVDLPDGFWELAAIPIAGWSAAIRRDLAIFDLGVLASALFLSVITYLLVFRDARLALRVAEGTRELSSALQHRTTVEAELRATQARYKTLVEVNPDAMLVNFNRKIVYANNAAARLLGAAAPEDLLGRAPFDLFSEDRRAELAERYERAVKTGQPNPPTVLRLVRLDGSIGYAEGASAPLAWDGGTAVQVILRDVSEQRRAEAWVRSLIDTTQDALVSMGESSWSTQRLSESSATAPKKSSVRKSTCSCPSPTPRSMMATSNGMNGPATHMPLAVFAR